MKPNPNNDRAFRPMRTSPEYDQAVREAAASLKVQMKKRPRQSTVGEGFPWSLLVRVGAFGLVVAGLIWVSTRVLALGERIVQGRVEVIELLVEP